MAGRVDVVAAVSAVMSALSVYNCIVILYQNTRANIEIDHKVAIHPLHPYVGKHSANVAAVFHLTVQIVGIATLIIEDMEFVGRQIHVFINAFQRNIPNGVSPGLRGINKIEVHLGITEKAVIKFEGAIIGRSGQKIPSDVEAAGIHIARSYSKAITLVAVFVAQPRLLYQADIDGVDRNKMAGKQVFGRRIGLLPVAGQRTGDDCKD